MMIAAYTFLCYNKVTCLMKRVAGLGKHLRLSAEQAAQLWADVGGRAAVEARKARTAPEDTSALE